jgi:hypothetical protein
MIPDQQSAINISKDKPRLKKVLRVDDKFVVVIHQDIVKLLDINDTTILEQYILDSAIVMKTQKSASNVAEKSGTTGYQHYGQI